MTTWMKKLFPNKKNTGTEPDKSKHRASQERLQSSAQQHKSRQSFLAVSIYGRDDCCAAARRITGQKFLAAHAPQLPLGGCSQPELCRCRYKHMTDRREEMRRDTDNGLPPRYRPTGERRNRRDRRHQFVS